MNSEQFINQSSLTERFNNNTGSQLFFKELESSNSQEKLVHTLAQYIDFNECFAPSVLNLASRVAASTEFHESDFFPPIASDRGAEIAAHIFFAAIDEYSRVPHRTLAQHTLKTTCDFFGLDKNTIIKITRRSQILHDIRKSIREAYGFNESNSKYDKMLFGIGAHVAAEGTAASEFKYLERYILASHKNLADHLEVHLHDGLSAFHWIKIHTIVEEKHFERAVNAANLAILYRPEGYTIEGSIDKIHQGIDCLQKIQEEFLKNVASE